MIGHFFQQEKERSRPLAPDGKVQEYGEFRLIIGHWHGSGAQTFSAEMVKPF